MDELKDVHELNEKDKVFCNVWGTIGVVLSSACLIQHLYMFPSFIWQAMLFRLQLVFSIVAFVLLIRKHPATVFCQVIAAALVFLYLVFLIYLFFAGVIIFSFVTFLLFFYQVIVLVLIYMNGLPPRLRLHKEHKAKESQFWNDKI